MRSKRPWLLYLLISSQAQLREQIYALLAQLMALPCASPVLSQDVYKTLFQPAKSKKGQPVPVTLSFDRTMSPR